MLAPSLTSATESSFVVKFYMPDGYGKPIINYEIEVYVQNGSTSITLETTVHFSPPSESALYKYTLKNLTSSTGYAIQIRACNSDRCGEKTDMSPTLKTLEKVVSLADIGSLVTVAATTAAAENDLKVDNTSFKVEKAPPPAEEIVVVETVVNETEVALLQAKSLLVAAQEQEAAAQTLSNAGDFEIAFSRASLGNFTVSESVGVLKFGLQLVRSIDGSTSHDGSTDPITVAWQVVSDSGSDISSPRDVAALEGVASFAAGMVNTSMSFFIVDNDAFVWGSLKRFELRLTHVTVGASSIMTSRSSIWINITDNDVPPSVSVHADSLQVDVTAGQVASIQLVRTGWLQSTVKISFVTDGSAQMGVDYTVGLRNMTLADRNASICSNISSGGVACLANSFTCSCAQACDGQ